MFGGIASAIGSIAGDVIGAHTARSEASKNRRFQREMSNTAHQREVKDLRKAGLNPILSAKYGGASTPPGSMASIPTPRNPVSAYQSYKAQAQAIDNAKETEKNLKKQGVLTDAQTAKTLQEARLTGANADQAEVMKGLYKAAVPFIHDLQDWVNSSRKASESGSGGILKGIWESLINSANDALPGTEERNKRNQKYRDKQDYDYKYNNMRVIPGGK